MCSKYDILIIEDEKVVIDSVKKILIPEGFKIDETFNVNGALKKLEQNSYKLILTDLMLPKVSGLQLTEIVNKKYPKIPIIVITGYATLENAFRSLKVGAFDFIPKPFSFEEIVSVVHRAIKFAETVNSSKQQEDLLKSSYRRHYPEGNYGKYYFLGKHSWARVARDGTARIGIGESFYNIIEEIQHIDFPSVNDVITQGKVLTQFTTRDQMKYTVWAPLSGQVVEHNKEVEKKIALIIDNPFVQGWLVAILPTNLDEELVNLEHHKNPKIIGRTNKWSS